MNYRTLAIQREFCHQPLPFFPFNFLCAVVVLQLYFNDHQIMDLALKGNYDMVYDDFLLLYDTAIIYFDMRENLQGIQFAEGLKSLVEYETTHKHDFVVSNRKSDVLWILCRDFTTEFIAQRFCLVRYYLK